MNKKITLTSYSNRPIDFRIDEIEEVIIQNEVTFIFARGRYAFPVKESKSRVLKMIETAK
ncbi:hypothetical protein [uncultured Haemophilus sp.]|uniref:hypothetical protein n=1 Tax=uncultured Haemophilus sp. TaxID=237779 RepID=UPI00260065AF|nr:hypothetical protein [uncultured Haemophilus sp.]